MPGLLGRFAAVKISPKIQENKGHDNMMPATMRHALAFLVVCSASLAAQNVKTIEGRRFTLIPVPNSSRWIHASVNDHDVFARLSDDRLFRSYKPEEITVTKIDASKDRIDVLLESNHLGRGKIIFENTNGWPPSAAQDLLNIILDGEAFSPVPSFVGTVSSKTVHFAGCNHLPNPNDSQGFSTPDEATADGYQRCPLCFKRFPRYSGFGLEQQVATFQAASVRGWGPPHMDFKAQERVQMAGQRVLEKWPLPLKGYRYRFVVLDSDIANAAAVANGQIYMTTALLNSMESDEALEAILAHEIAHVEMRHTWRTLRAARKAALWTGIATGLTAALSGSKRATDMASTISSIAASIVLSGYGRDMEEESDSFASLYFESQNAGSGHDALVNILSKLQYNNELLGIDPQAKGGVFASHPDLPDRIQKVKQTTSAALHNASFDGFNDSGERVMTVQFQWQRYYPKIGSIDQGFELVAAVDSTPVLGEKCKLGEIKVKTENGWLKLDNKEDTEVEPGEQAGLIFITNGRKKMIETIGDIQLEVKNVSSWKRSGDEGAR